jgi:hypothetical protein
LSNFTGCAAWVTSSHVFECAAEKRTVLDVANMILLSRRRGAQMRDFAEACGLPKNREKIEWKWISDLLVRHFAAA